MKRNSAFSRTRGRRAQRGFTLLEILLVAAILVILASMATIGFTAMQRSATSRLAISEIKTIENACKMFKINHQHFPSKLEELVQPVQGMNRTEWGGPYLEAPDFDDPWKQPYKYTPDEVNDRVVIISAGPDRQASTEDDVSNTPG